MAAVPFGLYYDWGVFMITGAGTILALITGSLHQWRAEKFACRRNTKKVVAITQGNGSRYVMVIFGCRRGLDLEDLAAGEGHRMKRPRERHGVFKKEVKKPRLLSKQRDPSHGNIRARRETWLTGNLKIQTK
jgi:hypothetical protein